MKRGAIVQIDVQVAISSAGVPEADRMAQWLERAARAAGCVELQRSVCVRVVDAAEGRALNRQYRGRDKATNVLSFLADLPPGLPAQVQAQMPLGDLVLCWPVVVAEAERQGKALEDHCAHLLVHGMLHLLGYDHEEADAAVAMEALEVAVLAQFFVADPYLIHPDGEVIS